jgi:superkiller protein 3
LYGEIINHAHTSDELRRQTEAKLLQFKYRCLYAVPMDRDNAKLKVELGREVQNLVEGIILLNIPNTLAWEIMLETQDVGSAGVYLTLWTTILA